MPPLPTLVRPTGPLPTLRWPATSPLSSLVRSAGQLPTLRRAITRPLPSLVRPAPRCPTSFPTLLRPAAKPLASPLSRQVFVIALALAALLALVPAAALAQPTLRTSFTGFTDTNGNGVLDCGEPVTVLATFATNNSTPNPLSGTLLVPAAGTSGLVFLPGSVHLEPDLTNGCQGTVTRGNLPDDLAGQIDFTCPADPQDNNAWTLVVSYRALYVNSAVPSFTATAHATTSDGRTFDDSFTQATAAACSGTPSRLAVTKTSTGPGTPGSVLVSAITATDLSGLGDGGLQLVETVPPLATFDPAASTPGWLCLPDGSPGATCRLQAGNVPAGGSLTAFFALTLAAAFPAGTSAIVNTACVREGPTTSAGCASSTTPTAGTPVLQLAKTLVSGTAAPGTTLTYRLAAANTGNQGLSAVTLTETVPAGTAFDPAGSDPTWSCSPGPAAGASCTLLLGPLAAGASATRTFALAVANPLPAGLTAIANTACAEDTSAPAPAPGTESLARRAPRRATAGALPAPGRPLPPTPAPPWGSAGTRSALAPPRPPSRSTPRPLPGDRPASPLSLSSSPAPAATIAACDTSTVPSTGQPVLKLAKTLASGSGAPGATLIYDLALQNAGNQDAGNLTLSETLPPATAFDSAHSSPGWTCAPAPSPGACTLGISGLPAGATLHTAFALTVARPLPAGLASFANTACASLPAGAPTCSTVTVPAAGHPLLTLAKAYSGGPLRPGATLAFSLTFGNAGDQDAAGVTATETVPPHSRFSAAASSPGWTCSPGPAAGATCTLAVGALAAGATASATFALVADDPLPAGVSTLANAACLAAASGEVSCSQAATPPPPTLTASLRDAIAGNTNPTAHPGDPLDYTLVLSNPSTSTATDVEVPTVLDPHLSLVTGSVTTTAGVVTLGNQPGDTLPSVHLATFAPGATVTITFRALVAATLPAGLQLLSSQANLLATDTDPTVSDDPDTPAPLDPTTTPVATATSPVSSVPTLGSWGLAVLAASLALVSLRRLHRRPPQPPPSSSEASA